MKRGNEMAGEAAHLAQAERHIAQAKSFIRQQEQLIAKLAGKDLDTVEAENFLDALTVALQAFERHRTLILERLGNG